MDEKPNKLKLYILFVEVNESQGGVLVSLFFIYERIYSTEHPVGRRVNKNVQNKWERQLCGK